MALAHLPGSKMLEVTVEEASGKNRADQNVWEQDNFEGFVKAEVRGGARAVKATTEKAPVKDHQITWQQTLHLEIQEGATELRLLLCREKENSNGKKGVSVITACGIYVKDILEAVPIDKYFEMFKPVSGLEGGYIRLRMKLVTPSDVVSRDVTGVTTSTKKRRGLVPKLVVAGAFVACLVLYGKRVGFKGL